jgi:hypothetical protein
MIIVQDKIAITFFSTGREYIMGSADRDQKSLSIERKKKAAYSAPEIIYEGKISIRAGTPESGVPGVPSSESLPFGDSGN